MSQHATTPTVSIEWARRLREAGLSWQPGEGDRFYIPDRDLGDRVWSISEMVIEERSDILGRRELAFNGVVEWALDSIITKEVIWLPTEGQLRDLLGPSFIALYREDDGSFACVVRIEGVPVTHGGDSAPDAYAAALLATMR